MDLIGLKQLKSMAILQLHIYTLLLRKEKLEEHKPHSGMAIHYLKHMEDCLKNKRKIRICVLILICCIFVGCMPKKNDIYSIFPIGSKLEINIIRDSNAIFKSNLGWIILYNLSDNPEEYNPHLLFFDSDKKLISACHFFSENIYSYKDNVIIAYLNKDRLSRGKNFRSEIPDEIKIVYKNYRVDYPTSILDEKESLDNSISYNENQTITIGYIKPRNDVKKVLNVPLHKITFNYEEEEIVINNTFDDETRMSEIFKVSKVQLDSLFLKILSN